jgi:transcriptional regulator with XRE-family HTH domain
VNTLSAVWKKFGKSKKYREEFVAAHLKRAIPHQTRALLKARKWPQQKLAEQASLSQGVVSRAVDPSYGNLTLNTIIRIAAGFDVAFIGRFVPFSELAEWYDKLPEENFDIPSFEQERISFETEGALGAMSATPSQLTSTSPHSKRSRKF